MRRSKGVNTRISFSDLRKDRRMNGFVIFNETFYNGRSKNILVLMLIKYKVFVLEITAISVARQTREGRFESCCRTNVL